MQSHLLRGRAGATVQPFRPLNRLATCGCSRIVPSQLLRRQVLCRAAASGSEDPYKVLGLSSSATTAEVNRAYKFKLADAKGNDAAVRRIEAAHTQIVMAAFNARARGGGAVPKEIKYADREVLLPWLPRFFRANIRFIALMTAILGGMAVYGWIQKTAMAVTVIGVGLVGNYVKQSAITPPPRSAEQTEEDKKIVGRNLFRSVFLTILATAPAYVLINYLPTHILPAIPQLADLLFHPAMEARPGFLLTALVCTFNWLILSFFR